MRARLFPAIRAAVAAAALDELSAGLTQVALSCETARASGEEPLKEDTLEHVAGMARERIGSLSDLAWAIRPQQDQAEDLIHRMRLVASEMLSTARMKLDFEAPEGARRARLDPERRRRILAVFKESIHNAARHSGGTFARVRLAVDRGSLVLSTANDGGPPPREEANCDGRHGIEGMRWRARMLGGRLDAGPAGGSGWEVTLRVPLRAARNREAAAETSGAAAEGGGQAA